MGKSVLILNGPNLNLLGTREPQIYGTETLADIEAKCRAHSSLGEFITFVHSNDENEIIAHVQTAITQETSAIIINAAALSHTSIALLDALNAYTGFVIEVHLSNIFRRESYRHHSYVSERADGIICGLKGHGYILALDAVQTMLSSRAGDSS